MRQMRVALRHAEKRTSRHNEDSIRFLQLTSKDF